MLKKWSALPENMKVPEVQPYYDALKKKQFSLLCKRIGDFILALLMLILLCFPMLILAIIIKCDSKGPVFYRQERVTFGGRIFEVLKFRSMRAEDGAKHVSVSKDDDRITKVGRFIRKFQTSRMPTG